MRISDYRNHAKERRLGDPTIWRVDDPTWMAERSDEWRKVQLRLAGCRMIHRSYWKYLKQYFFYGKPLNWTIGKDIEPIVDEVCTWWLHPTGENLGAYDDQGYSRRDMLVQFDNLYFGLRDRIMQKGDAHYGAMGGAEQRIMLAMNPGFDYCKLVQSRRGIELPECAPPCMLFDRCMVDTASELRSYTNTPLLEKMIDSAYFAHQPGLVLWDHISHSMGIDERLIYLFSVYFKKGTREVDWSNSSNRCELESAKPRLTNRLHNILTDILTFFDRPASDDSRLRPTTVAYVEMLLGRYEQRDFSDPLLKHWDQAKEKIPKIRKS